MKKFNKKFGGIILSLLMILSFSPATTVNAEEELTSISCGDGVYYTLSEDGVLTIFGDGTMTDYYNDWLAPDPGWAASRNSIKKIVIEEGVTEISGAAFGFMWSYPNVEEIEIPSSVTTLGPYAFGGCAGLQVITLGSKAPATAENALPNKEITVTCQAGTTGINTGIWTSSNFTIEGILETEVTVSSQSEGSYLFPIHTMSVKSNLAESYGYEDLVTDAVSLLDVLVAETQCIFGDDYTPEEKEGYLNVSETGWITTVFADETGAFTYRINQEQVMPLINAAPVAAEDNIQFYLYTDRYYYTDKYTYLSVEGDITVGTPFTVRALSEEYDSNWNTVLVPLVGASIGQLDPDIGLVTELKDGITNEDGNVSITFEEPGDYYLTAYGTDATDTQLIMNPLKVTVAEAPEKPEDISSLPIMLSRNTYTYDGQAMTPVVTIEGLTEGIDFEVAYNNNTNAGTATITITGTGNYTGEATVTFTIKRAKVAVPKAVTGLVYNGKTQTGVKKGTGYTLTGYNGKNAGTYTAKATLTSNYQWSDGSTKAKTIKWTIKKATPTVTISSSSMTVKYSSVKKNSTYTKAVVVTGAKGTKTFTKTSGSSLLTISKTTGKIRVKKGTKKGTYSITIKVTSAATDNYNSKTSAAKTIKVYIK